MTVIAKVSGGNGEGGRRLSAPVVAVMVRPLEDNRGSAVTSIDSADGFPTSALMPNVTSPASAGRRSPLISDCSYPRGRRATHRAPTFGLSSPSGWSTFHALGSSSTCIDWPVWTWSGPGRAFLFSSRTTSSLSSLCRPAFPAASKPDMRTSRFPALIASSYRPAFFRATILPRSWAALVRVSTWACDRYSRAFRMRASCSRTSAPCRMSVSLRAFAASN